MYSNRINNTIYRNFTQILLTTSRDQEWQDDSCNQIQSNEGDSSKPIFKMIKVVRNYYFKSLVYILPKFYEIILKHRSK